MPKTQRFCKINLKTSVLCSALEETAAAINNCEALQVAVSDAERLPVGAGLDAHTDFLPSSIDQKLFGTFSVNAGIA